MIRRRFVFLLCSLPFVRALPFWRSDAHLDGIEVREGWILKQGER